MTHVNILDRGEDTSGGDMSGDVGESSEDDMNVVLVNTISPYYLVRYQGPLAVNVLAKYVERKVERACVHCIDMQEGYEDISFRGGRSVGESFQETVQAAVAKICDISQTGPTIVGLSIKWAAVEVAKREENRGRTVVTIICDTGERYLSTSLVQ